LFNWDLATNRLCDLNKEKKMSKTLVEYFNQNRRDAFKAKLQGVKSLQVVADEQVLQIIQDEIRIIANHNSDYILGLTDSQRNLAWERLDSLSNWTVRSSRKINEFTRVSAPNVLHPSSRLTIAERLSMQGF
jgi:hypothetical protein